MIPLPSLLAQLVPTSLHSSPEQHWRESCLPLLYIRGFTFALLCINTSLFCCPHSMVWPTKAQRTESKITQQGQKLNTTGLNNKPVSQSPKRSSSSSWIQRRSCLSLPGIVSGKWNWRHYGLPPMRQQQLLISKICKWIIFICAAFFIHLWNGDALLLMSDRKIKNLRRNVTVVFFIPIL